MQARQLAEVIVSEKVRLPVIGLVIGSSDRSQPTLGLFGGVHGLERVGTQVALAYLFSLVESLQWDAHALARFDSCRIAAIPLVNPGGVYLNRRSNPGGIDLMRNAPVEAIGRTHWLLGGHRLSPRLPFYRGKPDVPIELESRTLIEFVEEEIFPAKASLSLDLHSGFGRIDRLWFPYARARHGFPRIVEVRNLKICSSKPIRSTATT